MFVLFQPTLGTCHVTGIYLIKSSHAFSEAKLINSEASFIWFTVRAGVVTKGAIWKSFHLLSQMPQ